MHEKKKNKNVNANIKRLKNSFHLFNFFYLKIKIYNMKVFDQLVDASKEIVTNKYVLIAGVTILTSTFVIKFIQKRKKAAKRRAYPRDVVILHQFPRGPHAPSASPYALKLETWYLFLS